MQHIQSALADIVASEISLSTSSFALYERYFFCVRKESTNCFCDLAPLTTQFFI
jgi:hypothetical protein